MTDSTHLPSYTASDIKNALLQIGASGTVYSLVMPETEAALAHVIDGGNKNEILTDAADEWIKLHGSLQATDPTGQSFPSFLQSRFNQARNEHYFSMYHEPWTQKQDAMHEAYFDKWFEWSSPIVSIDSEAFRFHYPTSGASEGIFKIMSEYEARCSNSETARVIHIFEGEYEGFPAFANSLKLDVRRHKREDWKAVSKEIGPGEQFWISQPSAIDGRVWDHFEEFVSDIHQNQPTAEVIPDLTYVGNVAREFSVDVNSPNIPCVLFSHSKPFGGYYHRVGGVVSKEEHLSLVGNKWFKNLQSLAWATEMMNRHGVYDLPRKYRTVQENACTQINQLLGDVNLEPADVMLLGTAKMTGEETDFLQTLLRGSGNEKVVRICLTPTMTSFIDPKMAPETAPLLAAEKDKPAFMR